MKSFTRILISFLLIFSLIFNIISCDFDVSTGEGNNNSADVTDGDKTDDTTNDDTTDGDKTDDTTDENSFGSEYPCITIAEALEIARGYVSSASTESYYVVATVTDITRASSGRMYIKDATGTIYVYKSTYHDGSKISETDLAVGDELIIYGTLRNYQGTLEIEQGTVIDYRTPGEDIPDLPDENDPYASVDVDEFYANYTPATSYEDAYYRTKHHLMSGTIAEQDQAPTISDYQPTSGGKLVRNTELLYSDDGNTYYVVDAYGEVVMEIYRGAAYIMLEEVAAYVFAFGEPPANQSYSKSASPSSSVWGIYLRVNHTKFSGDTRSYPYEPELPNISGCGGDLTYFEMDIGTTGTDCDPSYVAAPYNNGTSITRGAARIVYTCSDYDGNGTVDDDERYVFYTYNHYNDFQEYLNYEGGWGEMFGNITGGGTISSETDYNPTDYVEVTLAPITKSKTVTVIYYFTEKKTLLAA